MKFLNKILLAAMTTFAGLLMVEASTVFATGSTTTYTLNVTGPSIGNSRLQISPGPFTIIRTVNPSSKVLVAPYSIFNKGPETLDVQLTPDGFLTEDTTDLVLQPGETRIFNVYLTVPPNATDGTRTDYVVVDAQSTTIPRYSVHMKDKVTYTVAAQGFLSRLMGILRNLI